MASRMNRLHITQHMDAQRVDERWIEAKRLGTEHIGLPGLGAKQLRIPSVAGTAILCSLAPGARIRRVGHYPETSILQGNRSKRPIGAK